MRLPGIGRKSLPRRRGRSRCAPSSRVIEWRLVIVVAQLVRRRGRLYGHGGEPPLRLPAFGRMVSGIEQLSRRHMLLPRVIGRMACGGCERMLPGISSRLPQW